jgi:hypothetical protein
MKKLIFLSGFFILIFTSCKKQYINAAGSSQTILIDVASSAWSTNDYGVNYAAYIDVPEITSSFNLYGQVSVYISYGNGVFEQIPQVYNDVSYSFTHSTGNVSLYVQDITHHGMPPPSDATVKIILTDSGN